MRRFTTLTALVLGLATCQVGWAGDDQDKDKKADKADNSAMKMETVRGVVAGVTVEGETAVDYDSGRAVTVEAAYLTVVGSPRMMDKDKADDDKDDDKAKGDKSGSSMGRQNVYRVWLSPRTKVCECSDDSGDKDKMKDVALDKLEIGDRVEVHFSHREKSATGGNNAKNDSMKMKHGRHRIYSVDATSIAILPPDHDHDSADKDHDDDDDDKDHHDNKEGSASKAKSADKSKDQ